MKVRLVVIGEDGVGKTTLIEAFLKGRFPVDVPDRLPPIELTPDLSSLCSSERSLKLALCDSDCVASIQTTIIDCSGTD